MRPVAPAASLLLRGLVHDTGPAAPGRPELPRLIAAHRRRLVGPAGRILGALAWPASRLEALLGDAARESLRIVLVLDHGPDGLLDAVRLLHADDRTSLVGVEVPVRSWEDPGPAAAQAVRALAALPFGVPGFVEVHPTRGWRDAVGLLAARGHGARLRVGGAAEVLGAPLDLAARLVECVRHDLPLVLSPGSSSALPGFDRHERLVSHGVVNLLVATCRARHGGSTAEVADVLLERDAIDLLAELDEVPETLLVRVRRALSAVGVDDVGGVLTDLAGLDLVAKEAG